MGELGDGTKINRKALTAILRTQLPIVEKKDDGVVIVDSIDLKYAWLEKVDLSGQLMFMVDMSKAILTQAKFIATHFESCNLSGALLNGSVFHYASFSKVLLRNARLFPSSDRNIKIPTVDVPEVYSIGLDNIDYQNADEVNKHLADLERHQKQLEEQQKLIEKSILRTSLIASELVDCDLQNADLRQVVLFAAILRRCDLSGANLEKARLIGTEIKDCKLQGANLREADLMLAVYEPSAGSLPDINSFYSTKNLSTMKYENSPHGLIELRDALRKSGMRTQSNEVTYAIKHTETVKGLKLTEGFEGLLVGLLKWLAFEVTCEWGMSSTRPLKILTILILLFSLPYTVVLFMNRESGICFQWKGRIRKIPQKHPTKFSSFKHAFRIGFYLSLLSAFSIGWGNMKFGNWVTRIQRYDYALVPMGSIRTLTGIQSLVSVYLFALWILTSFGNPFEW